MERLAIVACLLVATFTPSVSAAQEHGPTIVGEEQVKSQLALCGKEYLARLLELDVPENPDKSSYEELSNFCYFGSLKLLDFPHCDGLKDDVITRSVLEAIENDEQKKIYEQKKATLDLCDVLFQANFNVNSGAAEGLTELVDCGQRYLRRLLSTEVPDNWNSLSSGDKLKFCELSEDRGQFVADMSGCEQFPLQHVIASAHMSVSKQEMDTYVRVTSTIDFCSALFKEAYEAGDNQHWPIDDIE